MAYPWSLCRCGDEGLHCANCDSVLLESSEVKVSKKLYFAVYLNKETFYEVQLHLLGHYSLRESVYSYCRQFEAAIAALGA